MQKINLDQIKTQDESKQSAFEELCMFLCCRELEINKIEAYKNQPGIETEPFEVKGEKIGFQVKFFEFGFDWEQMASSIAGKQNKKAQSKKINIQYPKNVFERYHLSKLYIYANKERTMNRSNLTKKEQLLIDISKHYQAEIIYRTNKNIKLQLAQPANFDLAQLYFGIGDEFWFIRDSVNSKILTFIQSKEYIDLPFIDKNFIKNDNNTNETSTSVNDIQEQILSSEEKIFIFSGNPGSGKTILLHKLLAIFGGLDQPSKDKMITVISNNNCIPILINMKNCYSESLQSIIRGRLSDRKVNTKKRGLIYLLDGLDELCGEKSDNVLQQIFELANNENTKKIIISCRAGNPNKIKLTTYFSTPHEFSIGILDHRHIDKFFEKKGDSSKTIKLNTFKKDHKIVIDEIKDILLVKLLWETINDLSKPNSIIGLFDSKFKLLMEQRNHKKNIDNLNLLIPKDKTILHLNQEIAFWLQERRLNKSPYSFTHNELQKFIMEKLDRLDYKSVDDIIYYIATLFFDRPDLIGQSLSNSYIYQHRRYQEYFLAQSLRNRYENNRKIIREINVISDRDFFSDFFLVYMRREYEEEKNLPGLIELNLIDVYLGKDNGFGADDDCYKSSNEFIPALISQKFDVFNLLFENEDKEIQKDIFIDVNKLKEAFKRKKADVDNYQLNEFVHNMWSYGIEKLITNTVLFWKGGKLIVAQKLFAQFNEVQNIFDEI